MKTRTRAAGVNDPPPPAIELLLLCYALSGFAALVYEVVWSRLFTLHLGHTLAAISTVLAAFLGGLGVGAFVGGEAAARTSRARALGIVAALELSVAASALAVPLVLDAITPLLSAAYNDAGSGAFAGVRLMASLALVGVPASLMGATFPFVVRFVADGSPRQDRRVAALMAFNTGGASLGAAAAGFFMIPALGLQRTTWVACAVSALSGMIAWSLVQRGSEQPHHGRLVHMRGPDRAKGIPIAAGLTASLITVGVTGFVTTASEVAWTRTLALIIGPTTYAFSVILATFIVGLALGSAMATAIVRHVRLPGVGLATALAIVAAVPAWSMTRVEPAAMTFGETVATTTTFDAMIRLQAVTTAMLLFPLAVALGAAFTSAVAIAARDRAAATQRVGRLYAINTLGAVAGSLGAGFVFVAGIGLQRTVMLASAIALAASLAVLATSRPSRARALAVLAVCAAAGAALWATPPWDMELLSGGVYKYARQIRSPDLRAAVRAGTRVYYREGGAGTVAVRRAAGVLSLSIDGKVDASTGGDMLTQKLLAHLPLLLHPAPRRIAIIGLGSGVTLGSALTHPISGADVIEISPEVAAASRQFDTVNRRALDDSRTRLILGDARSHFRFSGVRYDVVISEPSNPWMAGIAALFTREFFDAVRRHLTPDGIFCQWAHTYDMRASDLRSIAATFADVFPNGSLWLVGDADLLLIASTGDLAPKLAGIAAAYERANVREDLRTVAVPNIRTLLETYSGGPAELRSFAARGLIQTDDRMALEFSAPRGLVEHATVTNADSVRALSAMLPPIVLAARSHRTADDWIAVGRMFLAAEAHSPAYDAFASAIARRPTDENAIDGLLRAAAGAGRTADAEAILRSAASHVPHDVPVHIGLSRLAAARRDFEAAVEAVQPLMRDLPLDPRPFDQAAAVLADAGDLPRLRDLAQYQQERWPARPQTAYSAATLAIFERRLSDAHRIAATALATNPHEARLHNIVGAAAAGLGQLDEARRAFERALTQDPRDPAAYVNLGLLDLESGNPDAAARRFAEALLIDPDSQPARKGLLRSKALTMRP